MGISHRVYSYIVKIRTIGTVYKFATMSYVDSLVIKITMIDMVYSNNNDYAAAFLRITTY